MKKLEEFDFQDCIRHQTFVKRRNRSARQIFIDSSKQNERKKKSNCLEYGGTSNCGIVYCQKKKTRKDLISGVGNIWYSYLSMIDQKGKKVQLCGIGWKANWWHYEGVLRSTRGILKRPTKFTPEYSQRNFTFILFLVFTIKANQVYTGMFSA